MDTRRPADAAGQTPATLESIYEQYLSPIYRFIYSKVGNREEAEDLTAQVFLKAARGLDSSRDALSIQSWLFHVARTTVADHWREFYQITTHSLDDLLDGGWAGPQPNPVSQGAPSVSAARVKQILARLPERYREVLTYRFLLNYSVAETAAQLGLSEANVKVLQFRALKKAGENERANSGHETETANETACRARGPTSRPAASE